MKTNVRTLVLSALLAALTAVGAFLKIPTPISSFTLQFFFTCMAGVLLGSRYGALSQLAYVLLGLAGVPIFTGGGGVMYVFQPTFGFLIGLIPAAWVIGFLTERGGTSARTVAAACVAGMAVMYAAGLPYMHGILTLYLQKEWTVWQTVKGGMLLFLPWDALKITGAAILSQKLIPILKRAETSVG